jgi:nucleolar protein 15
LQLPSSSEEELSEEEGSGASADDLSEESENEASEDEEEDAKHIEAPVTPQIKHKVTKEKSSSSSQVKPTKLARGVIYLGRIPHGFHEKEMTKYFTQFGDITRLRLSRNKKTGKSKHYGFIEFSEHEVAKVAADTMNNYLLFGHLLKCHVLPKQDVHDDLFKGAEATYKAIPWAKISKVKHDAPKTQAQWDRLTKKHQHAQMARQLKLKAKGIDFDLSSIV